MIPDSYVPTRKDLAKAQEIEMCEFMDSDAPHKTQAEEIFQCLVIEAFNLHSCIFSETGTAATIGEARASLNKRFGAGAF
jgi:hypothetical protein